MVRQTTQIKSIYVVDSFHREFNIAKEQIYDRSGFELTNQKLNNESIEYGACSFELNEMKVQFRVSKITPTKIGQFVTIWKRGKNGITQPFDISDNLDFIIIASRSENNVGQFIFPKAVLADKGIITRKGKEGKRGIRVYPPWDKVSNRQAEKTQSWQIGYFLDTTHSVDLTLIRNLFASRAESK
jgi:hypothetical protein